MFCISLLLVGRIDYLKPLLTPGRSRTAANNDDRERSNTGRGTSGHAQLNNFLQVSEGGTSNPGNYGTAQQYQGVHSPTYPHHTQSAAPIPYASSQSVSQARAFDPSICSTFGLPDPRNLSAARRYPAVDSRTAPPGCRGSSVYFVASTS